MPPLGLPIYGQPAPAAEPARAGQPAPAVEPARRWRSLAEHDGASDPAAGTYPDGDQAAPESFGRRGFMQVLGASAALAGLAGCKPPREPVVSYVRRPAGVTPSLPGFYATAASRGGHAVGLVVESHEGRPTKIEGNKDHPASLGGAGLHELAAILDLYEPSRLAGIRRAGKPLAWTTLLAELSALAAGHAKDGGARLRFLVEPSSSPTQGELRRLIVGRFPRARFVAWDPTGEDAARRGHEIAFGRPLEAVLDLDRADVVLSLDADLLAGEGEPLRQARQFASRRTQQAMNRLYVAEPGFSVTGGMADHRIRLRAAEVLPFARGVARLLATTHGVAALAPAGGAVDPRLEKETRAVAADLARARGRSLVVAGRRQPPAVHALAAAVNHALGNVGQAVRYHEPALLDADAGPSRLAALAEEIRAGQVDTLVVTAWNPVFTAPADLELGRLLGLVKDVIYLAAREDETTRAAGTVVARRHALESWSDLRGRDGMATIVQPLVAPLFESTGELELLAAFVERGHLGGWRLVRDGWLARTGAERFDARWNAWLAVGTVAGSASPAVTPTLAAGEVGAALDRVAAPKGGLEAVFAPDDKALDGRFADNAWLQELPHPVSKLTWDNAALLSPATARKLGVVDGDVVTLGLRGRSVDAPVLVQPGHADDAVTLPLGYGRTVAGAAGAGVGFSAQAIRSAAAPWFDGDLSLRKAGRRHVLARTQEHFTMDGRFIAMAYDADALGEKQHELDAHRGPLPSILPIVDDSKEPYRWGMSIDLSKCLGCGACTLACQAENNIPVVGKEQVLVSREMHWIRVDRYYEGTPEAPETVSQPLACVHCEAAPCEYVCPVNATVHSDEGLNEMVYNRCVGTRYCSNNCAYKVRRFNYLDYRGTSQPTIKMLQNPDVTVRARGVMEKCTYCVQRIERARIGTRAGGEKLGGDAIQSACQQACPAEAIVFGNLADPTSRVARLHQDARRYDLLHELGTRPRTAYLVKLKNPNPDLA